MASLGRRGGLSRPDAWPVWVDALSNLLIVVIFVLMVFVVAQAYLSTSLSGRDQALQRLNRQLASLEADLRALRETRRQLEGQVAALSALAEDNRAGREAAERERAEATEELRLTREDRDRLLAELGALRDRSQALEARLAEQEERTVLGQREIERRDVRIEELRSAVAEAESALSDERALTAEGQEQVALLNAQIAELRRQLETVAAALGSSEARDRESQVQIADLGRRLNLALASRVEELGRYRSEFFGRLRETLGGRPDIRIVGDRFVFQSEVLFNSGSATLEERGRDELSNLAATLLDIASRIPPEVNWILRVDGHTDVRPINTPQFPSNWELSTARAIAVVRALRDQGIPADRLAAAGFGEFQPIDTSGTEAAFARNRRIEIKFDQR